MIRVMLIDDHALLRAGITLLVEGSSSIQVVGEAANRQEALALAAQVQPDIVLLDLDLNRESGLDLIAPLLDAVPSCRIILLTGVRDEKIQQEGIRRGAMGLVFKEQAADTLLKAIEKVYAGEIWLDRYMTATLLMQMARGKSAQEENPDARKIATLTEREREVIRLIGEGLKNKEIARRLSLSPVTVRHHLTSIYDKLGVADRLELVIYAYHHDLAKPPL